MLVAFGLYTVRVWFALLELTEILFITFIDRISRHSQNGGGFSGVKSSSLLQMMRFSRLHQVAASTPHWGGSQRSVKHQEWELTPPSLTEKGGVPRMTCCPKWKSSRISGPCSQMRGECSGRVQQELSMTVKVSIYRLIYVPTTTYGHELWAVTE